MVELLAFYFFGRRIGQIAASKGRDGNGFTALFIGLWLLGEVGGLLFGLTLTEGQAGFLLLYPIALLGAAGGAFFVYTIVVSLPDTPYGEPKRNRDTRPRQGRAGAGRKRAPRPADAGDRPAPRKRSALPETETYAFQDSAPARRRKRPLPYQSSY